MDLVAEIGVLEEEVTLPETSNDYQCVFRAPTQIRKLNTDAFLPLQYAIGPLHKELDEPVNNALPKNAKRKRQYYKAFRVRTRLSKEVLINTIRNHEDEIRGSYEEEIPCDRNELIKMILIDSSFIIECFIRYHEMPYMPEDVKKNDPIFSSTLTEGDLYRDLTLCENQAPLFILEEIYNLTTMSLYIPFMELCCKYFKHYNRQDKRSEEVNPAHFVDLLRHFLLPKFVAHANDRTEGELPNLYTATELEQKGLEFRASESKCLLDIEFQKGKHWFSNSVLSMPQFFVDDATECYLTNIISFEQRFSSPEPCIAEYIGILNCLIQEKNDVKILIANHIIVDNTKDVEAVLRMIKRLKFYVTVRNRSPMYDNLSKDLIAFHESHITKYMAKLRNEYFNTPWRAVATVGAVVVFIVGIIECFRKVFFWIEPYFR